MFASTASVFGLYVVHSEVYVVIMLCVFTALSTPAWNDSGLLIAELYPTHLRYILQHTLSDSSCIYMLGVYAYCCVVQDYICRGTPSLCSDGCHFGYQSLWTVHSCEPHHPHPPGCMCTTSGQYSCSPPPKDYTENTTSIIILIYDPFQSLISSHTPFHHYFNIGH